MEMEANFIEHLLLTVTLLAGVTIPLRGWMQRRSQERRRRLEEQMQAHILYRVSQQVLAPQRNREEKQ